MKTSIIIPTYGRPDALAEVIASLGRQTAKDFEVIVVDDGSPDSESNLRAVNAADGLDIRYIRQANAGPGAARNLGLKNISDDSGLVLFIGDDIIAHPDLVSQHADFHGRYPEKTAAVLGLTLWEEGVRDRFMDFLAPFGPQFNYSGKQSGDILDFRYLHTCNISFKRNLLEGRSFDEDFRAAAFEDTELGYRLSRDGGLNIIYNPAALGYHKHKYDRRRFALRQAEAAKWARLLARKHPEAEGLIIKSWTKIIKYLGVLIAFWPLYMIESILPRRLSDRAYRYYNLAYFELLFAWHYHRCRA